jgi:hypothetical protein
MRWHCYEFERAIVSVTKHLRTRVRELQIRCARGKFRSDQRPLSCSDGVPRNKTFEPLKGENRRRAKVIALFPWKAVLNLLYASLMAASKPWRGFR